MDKRTVFKAYKLLKSNENLDIDNRKIIRTILSFFKENDKNKWISFDLNYGNKKFNSLEKLDLFLESNPNITFLLGQQKNKSGDIFLYNNALDNIRNVKESEKPELTVLSILIIIDLKLSKNIEIEFFKKIEMFKFDYGYSFIAEKSFDLYNERIKKRFWMVKDISSQTETFWFNHLSSIRMGFFRNIYNINLLNQSHLKNEEINYLFKKYGELNRLNKEQCFWLLNDKEVDLIIKELEQTPYLLGNKKSINLFCKTSQKEIFRKEMSFPSLNR